MFRRQNNNDITSDKKKYDSKPNLLLKGSKMEFTRFVIDNINKIQVKSKMLTSS